MKLKLFKKKIFSTNFTKTVFIFFIFLIIFLTGCSPEPIQECEGYTKLKVYSLNDDTYYFSKKIAETKFTLLTDRCSVDYPRGSEDVFENYFTTRYVDVIDSFPQELTAVNTATTVMISIIEEPFADIDSPLINEKRDTVVQIILKEVAIADLYKVDSISQSYNKMYGNAVISYRDNELTAEELEEFQYLTAKFFLSVLDETNTTKSVLTKMTGRPRLISTIVFGEKLLRDNSDLYNEFRERKAVEYIESFLFETPSKIVYENFRE